MITIVLSYFGVFYLSLITGRWLCSKSSVIAKLGETIFIKKKDQLDNSPIFGPLRKAIKESSLGKAIAFIFPMIALKSIAFYFISYILITPIVLIIQGIMMGSLYVYNDHQTKKVKNLNNITFWQLFSHILAASYGTVIGIEWLLPDLLETYSFLKTQHNIGIYLILILITAFIASFLEAKSILTSAYNE